MSLVLLMEIHTILLLEDKTTIRIRMDGIDAPEKGMPFYKVSKKYLGELCFNKNVTYGNSFRCSQSDCS